ncbi:glycosyltransferase family 1 protein [Paenibacillaceae bacterium]|nr:glycosyltransferase family 1 protein [Paenibacillaceae bacterium]
MASTKIAFVTPGTFPLPSTKSSSVERVTEHIVPKLAGAVKPRIYGRISRKLPSRGMLQGVECVRFPAADKSKYVRAVGSSLAQYHPEVVVVENRPGYVLRIRKQLPRTPIWLNLHSSTFIKPGRISASKLRDSFRKTERIIVNSANLLERVAARVPEASSKLRVVYPGVDTNRFISQYSDAGLERRGRLRRARGWRGRKVVLFMGRLVTYKGVHHLMRVLPQLVASNPDILLVIVGSAFYGSHRTTPYVRRLHRLGRRWPHNVMFVPYVPYNEVPDWFVAADVAVTPSDQREAFGLVNVEAMASGLPVVATRAGGMKEIIEHGRTGYLINPAEVITELRDKLLLLMENNELRTAMGMRGRERVEENFTWERSAEQWLRLLEEDGRI